MSPSHRRTPRLGLVVCLVAFTVGAGRSVAGAGEESEAQRVQDALWSHVKDMRAGPVSFDFGGQVRFRYEHDDGFYHGEDVDEYKDGKIVGHGGAWRAGLKGARAGLMMPAKIEVGYRHYQEVAPGMAMDRAEIVSDTVTIETPEGEFKKCVRVLETTPLEKDRCVKIYAPGVGLVLDDDLVIVQHGPGRKPPTAPIEVKVDPSKYLSEVEIAETEMPAPVSAQLKKLHPTGKIKEVKRESHPGGKVIYAIEIMVDGQQWDVELDPDGNVIADKKE